MFTAFRIKELLQDGLEEMIHGLCTKHVNRTTDLLVVTSNYSIKISHDHSGGLFIMIIDWKIRVYLFHKGQLLSSNIDKLFILNRMMSCTIRYTIKWRFRHQGRIDLLNITS